MTGPELCEHLPFTTDAGVGARARIGLIVLATDYTMEHEFRRAVTTEGVDFFVARIENATAITPGTLADMERRIPATLKLILPGEKLDVVAFGCTSATVVMGEQTVFRRMAEVQPDAAMTTPITAAFRAFDALGARRIAVLTPYRRDVNQRLKAYVEAAGYEVPVFGSFNEERDPVAARIDADSLSAGIETILTGRDVDMAFVSCTSIRLMDAVAGLERRFGLPVTSSNHAMAWRCLRLAGVSDPAPELGRLFAR